MEAVHELPNVIRCSLHPHHSPSSHPSSLSACSPGIHLFLVSATLPNFVLSLESSTHFSFLPRLCLFLGWSITPPIGCTTIHVASFETHDQDSRSVTRSHKANDRDHKGLADGTAAASEHLPRFFAKSGFADSDPKKIKKDGCGKGNWGGFAEEVKDHSDFRFTNTRRRSNSSLLSHHISEFKTKFDVNDTEPVFEEHIHGPLEEEDDDDVADDSSKTDASESGGSSS